MNTYLTNPLTYLIDLVFFFFMLALMLRFLLQWVRADFRNPVSRFLITLTNPLLLPLRRLIPGVYGIDLASLTLLMLLAMIKLALLYVIRGLPFSVLSLIPWAIADLVALFLNIYLVTIIVQIVLSWLAPQQHNPVAYLLHQLNEPLLRPARRLLPPIEGFDFSPIIIIVILQLSKMILLPPLYALG